MIKDASNIEGAVDLRTYPESTSVNEAVWHKWLARNRADEVRGAERRGIAFACISAALLLTVAALWPLVGPYQRPLTFAITLGTLAVMFHAVRGHRYAVAIVFGAMALLYNPLFPMFPLTGEGQRLIVLASAAPFLALLFASKSKTSVPVRVR